MIRALFIIWFEHKNILNVAGQYFTQIIQCYSAYRLVVFQAIKQAPANTILIYQLISAYPFFL